MKSCTHYESLIGRSAAFNAMVASARPFPLPYVPIVYQEQPKATNGAGILPHRFKGNDGRDVSINGGAWEAANRNTAAQGMGEWFARLYGNYRGPIILNVESIPLDTPEARTFWEPVLDALKLACPNATFGFYDRPDLADLCHFTAPCLRPIKRINAECWANMEHEYTPAAYRQSTLASLARYPRTRPMYAVCNIMHDGGAWASCLELREQWRMAQDLGLDVIWWGSIGAEDGAMRRARACLDWIKREASRGAV